MSSLFTSLNLFVWYFFGITILTLCQNRDFPFIPNTELLRMQNFRPFADFNNYEAYCNRYAFFRLTIGIRDVVYGKSWIKLVCGYVINESSHGPLRD